MATGTAEPPSLSLPFPQSPALAGARPARPSLLGSVVFIAAVAVFFFISGASGLIYQVAWVRILGLIFGVTTHAVSTVLAGFMAGLALGSFVAGRVVERVRNPLRAYGMIEVGIGIAGLLTPRAFGALRDAYPGIYRAVEAQSAAWSGDGSGLMGGLAGWLPYVVRLVLAFVILMVPTTLMGATLPVMLKSSLLRGGSLGRSVSLLYAINTFGAIGGTVLCGFYLIAFHGVLASIYTAAAGNLAIGLTALVLSLFLGRAPRPARRRRRPLVLPAEVAEAVEPAPVVETVPVTPLSERLRGGVIYVAFAVSGLCGLGYEVIWTRLLALFAFDNSTYAFTAMLAVVLLGIAVGSWVISPLVGRRWINWWVVFALLELGIGVLAVLSITTLSHSDQAIAWLVAHWPALEPWTKRDDGWVAMAAFAAIVPPMLLSGMTFPVATVLYAGSHDDASRRVGSLYAANVLGAIAGSLLAGFVLMPLLTSQRSLVLLAAASALAGALVLWSAPQRPANLLAWLGKVALSVAGVGAFVWSTGVTPDMYQPMQKVRFPDKEVVWYKEGLESTVTIVKDKDGLITLYTNARGQARDEVPLVTFHRLLGHMPMMLHPNPKRALIVGVGGGATAGAITQHPGVQLDVAELSDAVLEGVRFFGHTNYRFYDDPTVRIKQADARNHLMVSGQKYDVISGDAIRPNDAGSATLYSVEYYRLVMAALNDDGMMTQWIPPFNDYEYKMVIRTFLAAFPYATLWQDGDVLIGSKSPFRIDPDALARRFDDPTVKAAMDEVGIPTAGELLHRFNADQDELRAQIGDGPIITDDRPYIEFYRTMPQADPPDMKRWSHDSRRVTISR